MYLILCRVVLTDLKAFVLINVYAPNAGDRSGSRLRVDFKVRFLRALKEKCDALSAAGRQVCSHRKQYAAIFPAMIMLLLNVEYLMMRYITHISVLVELLATQGLTFSSLCAHAKSLLSAKSENLLMTAGGAGGHCGGSKCGEQPEGCAWEAKL